MQTTVEHFAARFRFQEPDTGAPEGTIRGLAAVFDREFETLFGPTIIERGAFARSIAARPQVVLLWQHDAWEPIGRITEMRESVEGLEVVGRLSQTTRGKDALVMVRDGVIEDLSIGFDAIKQIDESQMGLRRIQEADLKEISLVTWGAASLLGARVREVNRAALTRRRPALLAASRMLDAILMAHLT